jgi:hypothetical protein
MNITDRAGTPGEPARHALGGFEERLLAELKVMVTEQTAAGPLAIQPGSPAAASPHGRVLAPRFGWPQLAVGAAAAVTAVAVTLALTMGGSPSRAGRPGVTGPALATGYVVQRVEDAVANDDRVMRESVSLVAPGSGGAAFFDGQLSYEAVTWAYQGRNSTETFGAHGKLQDTSGTGIVNGKLQAVQVDYIRHQWGLISGNFLGAPVNACTNAGFLDALNSPDTDWPLLIVRTLACGGYKMAGYADIGGAETVKITGSRVIGIGAVPGAKSTVTVTLFVSPSTYLPVRITQSIRSPGLHSARNSAGIQWLSPTTANRARASVTVPCGYQQVSSSSGNPIGGQPSSACTRS